MTEQNAVFVVPDAYKQLWGETAEQHRDRLLMAWEASKTALDTAKANEMELRKTIAALAFPDAKEGTNKLDLGKGYELKFVREVEYVFPATLSRDAIAKVEDEIAKTGNEGQFLADRLFKWKCEPSKSEYKKLDLANPTHAAVKKLYDSILTTKDAAPKLEIKAPKGK